ncbi:hypothetical protein HDZ31DRAFT_81651 [Schizophyllum fasciatum]
MSSRPQTSKPRGVCAYYKQPRGCFAGSRCKFLHGEPSDANAPKLTPYDAAKTCRFFANGYCRHGDSCWFKHIKPGSSSSQTLEDAEDDGCGICYEKPTTYGLLGGCSHVFCLDCLRQWRDPSGKSMDLVESRAHKKCPMCRAKSAFITPSSIFIKHGDPAKDRVIGAYKESMAKKPCRHFQESKARSGGQPHCPFGRECFYQHLNDDGSPYHFPPGYTAPRSAPRVNFAQSAFVDGALLTSSLDILDGILSDPSLHSLSDNAPAAIEALRAGVQRLGNVMFGDTTFGGPLANLPLDVTNSLAAQWDLNVGNASGEGLDVEVGDLLHELVAGATRRRTLEQPPRPVSEVVPRPNNNREADNDDDDDDDSMPELQSVSSSSASEAGDSEGSDAGSLADSEDELVPIVPIPSPWGDIVYGDGAGAPAATGAGNVPSTSRFTTSVSRAHLASTFAGLHDSDSEDDMPPLEPVDAYNPSDEPAAPSRARNDGRASASSSPPLPTEFTTNGEGRVVFSGPEAKAASIPFNGHSGSESEDDMPPLEPLVRSDGSISPAPGPEARAGPSTVAAAPSSPPLPTEFVTDGQGRVVFSGSEGSAAARTLLGRMYNTLFPTSNL